MRQLILHRGLVLLAGLILGLHAALPHVHAPHGTNGEVVVFADQPNEERSLIQVLTDLVTADLGEEHLEHFTPVDSDLNPVLFSPPTPLAAKLASLFVDQNVTGPQVSSQAIIAYHPLLPEEAALVRQRPLRGPPRLGKR